MLGAGARKHHSSGRQGATSPLSTLHRRQQSPAAGKRRRPPCQQSPAAPAVSADEGKKIELQLPVLVILTPQPKKNVAEPVWNTKQASMSSGGTGTSASNTVSNSKEKRKNAQGNRLDPGWQHGVDVLGTGQKVRCKYCDKEVSGISRFKHHLDENEGDDAIGVPDPRVDGDHAYDGPFDGGGDDDDGDDLDVNVEADELM
ncbi:unnamed protein product [Linum trigynum]|uniref:BED-type domain-containing protein n=1 Tax=Linum trigynum TaxID=586398 RepID=A0AAV2D6Y2_9ROSI